MGTELASVRNPQKLQQWISNIQACRASGMQVPEWCAANGYNVKTYYRWHRIIRTMAEQNSKTEFYEIPCNDIAQPSAIVKVAFGEYKVELYSISAIREAAELCRELNR